MNESMPAKPIRVLIADDHPVILEGLALLLKPHRNISIVGFARSGDELMQKAGTLRPDVILLDVIMPDCLASKSIKELKTLVPDARVICCSGAIQQEQLRYLINSGIHGFVLKSASSEELRTAIETAYRGGNHFSQEITDMLIKSLRGDTPGTAIASGDDPDLFSDKEIKIIRLICQEKSVKEMSEETTINARTIESIKMRIMKKMDVRNIAGVVSYALRHKFVNIAELNAGN